MRRTRQWSVVEDKVTEAAPSARLDAARLSFEPDLVRFDDFVAKRGLDRLSINPCRRKDALGGGLAGQIRNDQEGLTGKARRVLDKGAAAVCKAKACRAV